MRASRRRLPTTTPTGRRPTRRDPARAAFLYYTPSTRHSVDSTGRARRSENEDETAVRLIGVIDLLGARAVHARAGRRDRYQPVEAVARFSIPAGDPLSLARAYTDHLGITELYIADLDAILGRGPQDGVIASLAALGAPIWLDSGVTT